MLLKFTKSEYLDSIYYADMFNIHGKVWMIMGCGKSTAARIASNKEENADIARDGVAITEKNKQLFGRYDIGAIGAHADPASTLHAFHQIDFIAFCLNEQETEQIFGHGQRKLIATSAEKMAKLSVVYPYPASAAQFVCSPKEIETYAAPELRERKFKEIVSSTEFNNFLLVPYMASADEKAALYVEHSKNT